MSQDPAPANDLMERLLREEIPTGRVRDWNARCPEITPEEAARNRELLAATVYRRPRKKEKAA